jgi:hypothetical protein
MQYEFSSTWSVDAPPDMVFRVLHDVAGYPAWWPQIRRSEAIDPTRVRLWARSFLPIDLKLLVVESLSDRSSGMLRADLHGDLEGWSSWRISELEGRTVATFDEVVDTTRRLMNVLAPVARRLFVMNHERMMRDGEIGLRAHLERLQHA